MESYNQLEVYIDEVAEKGRILRASRKFSKGEVIFRESSYVHASYELDICTVCDIDHETFDEMDCPNVFNLLGENITNQLPEIIDFLVELDAVGEVDRARMLLKCIRMDPNALSKIENLSFVNYQKCEEAMHCLKDNYPEIIPKDMTVKCLATVLAVLNTNSHELEQLQGSGLFPTACMMEHSCVPVCNFTTFGNQIWITALMSIEKGQSLSIDYGNFFYRPKEERQLGLQASYGFHCACVGCSHLPDRTRAFVCHSIISEPETPTSDLLAKECSGVVCPYPSGDWKCLTCQQKLTNSERDVCLKAEKHAQMIEFCTVEEIDSIIHENILHSTHHIIFWELERLGCAAAASPHFPSHTTLSIWDRVIASIIAVVPDPHSEKVIYFEKLGQVKAALGDVQGAKDAYGLAYQESCRVSGAHSEATMELYQLFINPPTSRADIIAHYANSGGLKKAKIPDMTQHIQDMD